jgi:hypothetical protein
VTAGRSHTHTVLEMYFKQEFTDNFDLPSLTHNGMNARLESESHSAELRSRFGRSRRLAPDEKATPTVS